VSTGRLSAYLGSANGHRCFLGDGSYTRVAHADVLIAPPSLDVGTQTGPYTYVAPAPDTMGMTAPTVGGSALVWGSGTYRWLLGETTLGELSAPVAMHTERRLLGLAIGGDHGCGLLADTTGTVGCWGANYVRQLGADLPQPEWASPLLVVDSVVNVVLVATGYGFSQARLRDASPLDWASWPGDWNRRCHDVPTELPALR